MTAPDRPPRRRREEPLDPMRSVAVAALAIVAALACIAFATQACAAPQASAPAPSGAPRYALVLQDATPLRAAPRAVGAPLATLGQGELVELRGERMDYAKVYDTRLERGGFVRASAVRPLSLETDEAAELLGLARFLRDRPGMEALGLGVSAAYLRAAPAPGITAEIFDAMGTMAERLAWRANVASAQATIGTSAKAADALIATQLQVAVALGVRFDSLEHDGVVSLCYDGEAFRHVLAMSPTPVQAARAVLGLTRPDCVPPDLPPLERWQRDRADEALLERISFDGVPGYVRNRLRMRRAVLAAAVAFEDSRRLVVESSTASAREGGLPAPSAADVRAAGQSALDALAAIEPAELADDDQSTYADAAMRVGASRWAAEPDVPAPPAGKSRLAVVTRPGRPGETCVMLVDAGHDAAAALARRCTYGTVWTASARANASSTALALAVQPLAAWRELWMFRRTPQGWTVQVLPPSPQDVGVGYVEFAGWVPATGDVLAAREVRDPARAGRSTRTFELLDLATLRTRRAADAPGSLTPFYRWQDPQWKRVTVSLR